MTITLYKLGVPYFEKQPKQEKVYLPWQTREHMKARHLTQTKCARHALCLAPFAEVSNPHFKFEFARELEPKKENDTPPVWKKLPDLEELFVKSYAIPSSLGQLMPICQFRGGWLVGESPRPNVWSQSVRFLVDNICNFHPQGVFSYHP